MRAVLYTALLLSAGFVSGCGEPDNRAQEHRTVQPSGEHSSELGGRAVDFGSGNYNELWDKATVAIEEGRLWAPSGNNAVEFYLQIKQGVVLDETNESQEKSGRALGQALDDLTPILSLAIDEAIESRKLQEASRLIRMLAAIDSGHPSLSRQIEQVRAIASPTPASPTPSRETN